MKKLEIGSGNKPKDGFVHFDIRQNVNADIVGDARKLPFRDGEFECVFSRFFLEHLPRQDAKIALKEMFRVLANKGDLEIIVPNLEYFCKLFISESGQKKEWALNKMYGFENYIEDHHFFGYDFEILSKYVTEAGFVDILRAEEKEEQYLHITAKKP
jgi:predicted SAM-dependent methyltransferase